MRQKKRNSSHALRCTPGIILDRAEAGFRIQGQSRIYETLPKKTKAKEKLKGSVKDYYTEKQAAYFTFTNLPLISGSSPSFLLSSIRIS